MAMGKQRLHGRLKELFGLLLLVLPAALVQSRVYGLTPNGLQRDVGQANVASRDAKSGPVLSDSLNSSTKLSGSTTA